MSPKFELWLIIRWLQSGGMSITTLRERFKENIPPRKILWDPKGININSSTKSFKEHKVIDSFKEEYAWFKNEPWFRTMIDRHLKLKDYE